MSSKPNRTVTQLTIEEAIARVTAYVAERANLRKALLKEARTILEVISDEEIDKSIGRKEVRKILWYPSDLTDERLLADVLKLRELKASK